VRRPGKTRAAKHLKPPSRKESSAHWLGKRETPESQFMPITRIGAGWRSPPMELEQIPRIIMR